MLPFFAANRVSPLGDLEAATWRGTLMGNRGRIGDGWPPSRAWITCTLSPRRSGRTEPLYTKLFFSDEAAALAAGHRPCAQCRPEHYRRFKAAWCQAVGASSVRAQEIDRRLGRDRFKPRSIVPVGDLATLPDGSFVLTDRHGPCVVIAGSLLPWREGRYAAPVSAATAGICRLITPATTLRALRAGYQADINREGDAT
jgi:hypothetical protein